MTNSLTGAAIDLVKRDPTLRLRGSEQLHAKRDKGNLDTTRPMRTGHEHSCVLLGLLLDPRNCPNNMSEQELHALCHLHNELNEVKIALDVNSDGKATMRLHRPC